MTNPTLERAARAAYDGHGFKPRDDMGGDLRFEELAAFQQENWRTAARAVLMAVREPDETMVKAAEDREEEIVGTYGCADPTGGFETDGPKICFTAMIDAILAEGE